MIINHKNSFAINTYTLSLQLNHCIDKNAQYSNTVITQHFLLKWVIEYMRNAELETSRLKLRQWKDSDYLDFALMNADQEVMRYFPKLLNTVESNLLAVKFKTIITENGWGFWAVELKDIQQFIGFVGLHAQPSQFTFSPCVEIGWRLAKDFWHQGYATEAAQACLKFAFQELKLDEVVSFTAVQNQQSAQVMQRLGMQAMQEFNHPALNQDDPLARHILYHIKNHHF